LETAGKQCGKKGGIIMQGVEIRGLEEFDKRLDAVLKEMPEARRKLNEELAAMVRQEADTQIALSGVRRNIAAKAVNIAEKFADEVTERIRG